MLAKELHLIEVLPIFFGRTKVALVIFEFVCLVSGRLRQQFTLVGPQPRRMGKGATGIVVPRLGLQEVGIGQIHHLDDIAHRQAMFPGDKIKRDPVLVVRQTVGITGLDQRLFEVSSVIVFLDERFEHRDDDVQRRHRLMHGIEVNQQPIQILTTLMQIELIGAANGVYFLLDPAQQLNQVGHRGDD